MQLAASTRDALGPAPSMLRPTPGCRPGWRPATSRGPPLQHGWRMGEWEAGGALGSGSAGGQAGQLLSRHAAIVPAASGSRRVPAAAVSVPCAPTTRVTRLMREEMPCHLPNCLASLEMAAVGVGAPGRGGSECETSLASARRRCRLTGAPHDACPQALAPPHPCPSKMNAAAGTASTARTLVPPGRVLELVPLEHDFGRQRLHN